MIPFQTYKREKPLDETNPESPIQKLMLGCLGKALILDAAPTQANNSIIEGEVAFYGTKIYWKLEGTLYEFTLTQTA